MAPSKIVESRRLILVTTRWRYSSEIKSLYLRIRKSDRDHKGESLSTLDGYGGVEDMRDATDFINQPENTTMELFFKIKERLRSDESIELNDIEVTFVATPVVFNEEAQREHLRQSAFSKLSEDEVKALGVEALAIYNKLKNHEA